MLRINLLPIRQLKKRSKARNQLFAFFLIFCVVLALLGATGVLLAAKISELNEDIVAKTNEKGLPGKEIVDFTVKTLNSLQ